MSERTEGIEYDGSNAEEIAEYVGWLSKGLVKGSSSLLVLTEDSSIDMQVGDRIVADENGLRLVSED